MHPRPRKEKKETWHTRIRVELRDEHGAKTSVPGSSTEHNLQLATMAKRGLTLPLMNLPKARAAAHFKAQYDALISSSSLENLGRLFPNRVWCDSFKNNGWAQLKSGLNVDELRMIKVIERLQLAEMGIDPLDATTHHHGWASATYDLNYGWQRTLSPAHVYCSTHPLTYCLWVGLTARMMILEGFEDTPINCKKAIELRYQT